MKDNKVKNALEAAQRLSTNPVPPKKQNVAASLSPKNAVTTSVEKFKTINDEFDHDVAVSFGFLGTGQGGCRIAQAFWDLGYRRVGAFNTTASDFNGLTEEMPKYSLDIGGAGKDVSLAKQALKVKEPELYSLMQRSWGSSVEVCLVCASLGGGTGSGTVVPIVSAARKYMADIGRPARVGAVVSLPPVNEGQQISRNAANTFIELLREKVSPLIVLDNKKINDLYRPSVLTLHSTANNTVAQLLHIFNKMAAVRSTLLTFDRAEFMQLLDGHIVTMSATDIDTNTVDSPTDIADAIRADLLNNVLVDCDLRKGKKAACLFIADSDVLNSKPIDFFDAGYDEVNRIIGSDCTGDTVPVVHRGLYVGTDPGVQCYTMISDLPPPVTRLKELSAKGELREYDKTLAGFLGVD